MRLPCRASAADAKRHGTAGAATGRRRPLELAAWPDITVVFLEMVFIRPIDHDGRVIRRAVFDSLTIDTEVHQIVRPIDLSYRLRRDQDLLARQPVLRIDDEVMDAPIFILHEEVFDMTDLAVAGVDTVPIDSFCPTSALVRQI